MRKRSYVFRPHGSDLSQKNKNPKTFNDLYDLNIIDNIIFLKNTPIISCLVVLTKTEIDPGAVLFFFLSSQILIRFLFDQKSETWDFYPSSSWKCCLFSRSVWCSQSLNLGSETSNVGNSAGSAVLDGRGGWSHLQRQPPDGTRCCKGGWASQQPSGPGGVPWAEAAQRWEQPSSSAGTFPSIAAVSLTARSNLL